MIALEKIIKAAAKKKFGSVEIFCQKNGHPFKNNSRKVKSIEAQLHKINDYLEPLDLEVQINEKSDFPPAE